MFKGILAITTVAFVIAQAGGSCEDTSVTRCLDPNDAFTKAALLTSGQPSSCAAYILTSIAATPDPAFNLVDASTCKYQANIQVPTPPLGYANQTITTYSKESKFTIPEQGTVMCVPPIGNQTINGCVYEVRSCTAL